MTFRASAIERWLGPPMVGLLGLSAGRAVASAAGGNETRVCRRTGSCISIPAGPATWIVAGFLLLVLVSAGRYVWRCLRDRTVADGALLRIYRGRRIVAEIGCDEIVGVVGSGGRGRSQGRFLAELAGGRRVRLRGMFGSDDGALSRGMFEQHRRFEAAVGRSIPFRRTPERASAVTSLRRR